VHAYDRAGTDLGDVTAGSTISMTPDGSCPEALCSAARSGPHEVLAVYAGRRAQSHVDIRPRAEIAALVLDPAEATIAVGAEQAYLVRAVDARNADLGDVTDQAVLTVRSPGRCDDRCSADRSADLEVTATLSGASGRSILHVIPEEPAVLIVDPAAPAVAAGTRQPFHVRGLDTNRNDLGDVTTRSTFILRAEGCGSCTCAVCVARIPGDRTVSVSLPRRQGGPLVATVPFRVVASKPTASRSPRCSSSPARACCWPAVRPWSGSRARPATRISGRPPGSRSESPPARPRPKRTCPRPGRPPTGPCGSGPSRTRRRRSERSSPIAAIPVDGRFTAWSFLYGENRDAIADLADALDEHGVLGTAGGAGRELVRSGGRAGPGPSRVCSISTSVNSC
jgi:hypothetical protein